jgi:hypothetical protein
MAPSTIQIPQPAVSRMAALICVNPRYWEFVICNGLDGRDLERVAPPHHLQLQISATATLPPCMTRKKLILL